MNTYYTISRDKLFDASNWEQFQMARFGNILVVPQVPQFDEDTIHDRRSTEQEEIELHNQEKLHS